MAGKKSKQADLPVSTIYLLKRAELAVRGCVEMALVQEGLTPNQYFVLVLVKFRVATSSAELARAMGVLPQSMGELIAPLEKGGAIVRRPDPANNRILRIELTRAGERHFARATEVAIELERGLLSGFAQRDLDQLNRLLDELTAKAEAHACHPKVRRLTKSETKSPAARTRSAAGARRAGGPR